MPLAESRDWLKPTLIAVGLITLLRVVALWGSPTDLYVDESQYWLWGQNFDFGYYSKPPMIGWVLRLFDELAINRSAFTVRLPAPLFHGITALILGAWEISSIRYCDMVSPRPSRRTRIVTDRANLDRCTAAWPAEFPPPTT